MKVVQVPFCFYPDPVGGTEVYVESLSQRLKQRGVDLIIVAPGERNDSYRYRGIPVKRFAVKPRVDNLRELYDEGDPQSAGEFSRLLDQEGPDLVHLHAFTRGVSLRLVREAKSKGIPVVFTYHTPTVSCQRGTLIRWGREVCDGTLRLYRCSRCTLHGLGLGKGSAYLMGSTPSSIGRWLGDKKFSGKLWTALRMTELVGLRHHAFHRLMAEVNTVIVTADWVKALLVRNGVASLKIVLSRHGLYSDFPSSGKPALEKKGSNSTLKVAFMGRLDPTKGLHVLIQVLKASPQMNLTLHIYGITQGERGRRYAQEIHDLIDGDRRIFFHSPISHDQVIATLRDFDVLAVPSQWLETWPMVILEAFAAGVPVVGSNRGGISELVEHEVNGLLVPPDSVKAWSETFRRICEDRGLLVRLREGIRPPRRMEAVAQEMEALYETLLQETP